MSFPKVVFKILFCEEFRDSFGVEIKFWGVFQVKNILRILIEFCCQFGAKIIFKCEKPNKTFCKYSLSDDKKGICVPGHNQCVYCVFDFLF